MKNLLFLFFLVVMLISIVFFNALDNRPMRLKENASLIAIQYYTDNCLKCQELNHKMHKINWLLGREAINFLTYDQSNPENLARSEQKIQTTGILDLARKNRDLHHLILFDAKKKKSLLKIDYQEDVMKIEAKIKSFLSSTSSALSQEK